MGRGIGEIIACARRYGIGDIADAANSLSTQGYERGFCGTSLESLRHKPVPGAIGAAPSELLFSIRFSIIEVKDLWHDENH